MLVILYVPSWVRNRQHSRNLFRTTVFVMSGSTSSEHLGFISIPLFRTYELELDKYSWFGITIFIRMGIIGLEYTIYLVRNLHFHYVRNHPFQTNHFHKVWNHRFRIYSIVGSEPPFSLHSESSVPNIRYICIGSES